MQKNGHHPPTPHQTDLPGIVYIIAFLIGVLLFLFFGESLFGIRPDPTWIALLMGVTVSAIVFWVWGQIHGRNKG